MPDFGPSDSSKPDGESRNVGGYRLLRPVGEGGMSRVFLSFDVASGSPVAVKILADHLAHSREFVGRFYREARLSRLLAHPHLVRGLAAGYDADFTIVDLKRQETISNSWIASKSQWTPYDGKTVTGWPVGTLVRGNVVMWDGELTAPSLGEAVRFEETLGGA